jgi:hypothetical protein
MLQEVPIGSTKNVFDSLHNEPALYTYGIVKYFLDHKPALSGNGSSQSDWQPIQDVLKTAIEVKNAQDTQYRMLAYDKIKNGTLNEVKDNLMDTMLMGQINSFWSNYNLQQVDKTMMAQYFIDNRTGQLN